jgi:hypothetical protein
MKTKKHFADYGIYIPLALMVIFTLQNLHTSGTSDWVRILFQNALVYGLGCQMVGFAIGHLFFGNKIAAYIGWKKGDPFQFEVGAADLGIGVLGIMCAWFSGPFWLATVIVSSIFLEGCVVGHIRDMIRNRNFSPGSAGFVFYWGLLFPILLIVLLAVY